MFSPKVFSSLGSSLKVVNQITKNSNSNTGARNEKTNSNSQIIFKSHEEVFGKAFEDPKRRTPGIDKIIEFTGMKPTKNIEFMIENIINFKKNN